MPAGFGGRDDTFRTVSGPPVMIANTDRNKDLIRRWIAFANTGFAGRFDQFIADDYLGHMGAAMMNRTELERAERQFCAAFPDAHHSIDDLIAEGDRVVLRTTARATHRGEFEGIPATHRAVEFTGLVVYRIAATRSLSPGARSTSSG